MAHLEDVVSASTTNRVLVRAIITALAQGKFVVSLFVATSDHTGERLASIKLKYYSYPGQQEIPVTSKVAVEPFGEGLQTAILQLFPNENGAEQARVFLRSKLTKNDRRGLPTDYRLLQVLALACYRVEREVESLKGENQESATALAILWVRLVAFLHENEKLGRALEALGVPQ